MEKQNKQVKKWDGEKIVEENASKVNGLSSIEERLNWCEQYIKILLTSKDESQAMHILDGKDISKIKERLTKLEEKELN